MMIGFAHNLHPAVFDELPGGHGIIAVRVRFELASAGQRSPSEGRVNFSRK